MILEEFENQYTPKIHDFKIKKEAAEQEEEIVDEKKWFANDKSLVPAKKR